MRMTNNYNYTSRLETIQNEKPFMKMDKNKKSCSICFKPDELKRLPDEFQQCSMKKGFESYFCGNCCQIVNFLLTVVGQE